MALLCVQALLAHMNEGEGTQWERPGNNRHAAIPDEIQQVVAYPFAYHALPYVAPQAPHMGINGPNVCVLFEHRLAQIPRK